MSAERVTDTRRAILEAADQLINDRGFMAATTREIARAAKCAEGSIYRYFEDKHALFMEVVKTHYSEFFELMDTLPDRAGTSAVRRNVEEVARSALDFYRGIIPMVCGAVAEHLLLQEHREYFRRHGTGPVKMIGSLAEYLRREQRLGRISQRVSPEHAARLVMGTCYAESFLMLFLGDDWQHEGDQRFARELVKTAFLGLEPESSA